jgi:hypothetical protein
MMAEAAMMEDGTDFAAAAIERNRRMMRRNNGDNPMGPTASFGERRSEQLAVQRYSIICTAVTAGIILLIIILIAEFYKKTGVSCGIPVITWVEIFFVIYLGMSVLALFLLIVLYNCYNDMLKWQIGFYVFFGVLLLAWTIYGYVIYFSDDNDCQEHAGTSGWLVFMVILLVLALLLFTILLCCVLPLFLYIMHVQEQ